MNLYGFLSDEKSMAGMLYGMNPKTIVTAPAGENINYGKGVFLNSNGVLKASKEAGTSFAGVSVFHQNAFLNSRGLYVTTEAVNVMEKGYIYVALAESVEPTVGATAYVTPEGLFTTSADNGETGDAKVEYDEVGVFKSGKETGSNNDSIALVYIG